MPLVLVNLHVTAPEGVDTAQEGCLSFPDKFVTIKRASEVTVVFTDLESREHTLKVRGLLARTVQHEMDHLNAVLLVDRMSPVQKVAARGKLKRLMKSAVR
jgi:peptide deformylase